MCVPTSDPQQRGALHQECPWIIASALQGQYCLDMMLKWVYLTWRVWRTLAKCHTVAINKGPRIWSTLFSVRKHGHFREVQQPHIFTLTFHCDVDTWFYSLQLLSPTHLPPLFWACSFVPLPALPSSPLPFPKLGTFLAVVTLSLK